MRLRSIVHVVLILSLTVVLMGSGWTPDFRGYEEQELDQNVNQLLKFTTRDSKNPRILQFDEKEAEKKGASDEMKQMGKLLEQFSSVYDQTGEKMGIPLYGNWCGPNHGGGEPIDYLDAQCKEHDLCYMEKGDFNCTCDQQLIAGIRKYYSRMKPKEKVMAVVIVAYFTVAPCQSQK